MRLEHFKEIRQALIGCGIEAGDADAVYAGQRIIQVLGESGFVLEFLHNLGLDTLKIVSGGALSDDGRQAIVDVAKAAHNYKRGRQLLALRPQEVYERLIFRDIDRLLTYGKDLRREKRD